MPSSPERQIGIAQIVVQLVEVAAPVAGDRDHAHVEVGFLPQRLLAILAIAHQQQRIVPGGIESRQLERVGHLADVVGIGLRKPQHDDVRLAQPCEAFGKPRRRHDGIARSERRGPIVEVHDDRRAGSPRRRDAARPGWSLRQARAARIRYRPLLAARLRA
jgi:hypothetical protein